MTRSWSRLGILLGVAAFSSPLAAQLNVQWAEFLNQTATRMVAAANISTTDPDEKDYAFGDVDRDGDLDLVNVRKEQAATLGKRVNVLFMNEGIKEGRPIDGVLVDRTSLYAVDSDVPGDQGFNTATNDRDVELVDLTGDGWLDIFTSTTLSDGDPKYISHPRVYVNKGNDVNGNWLGFRFENGRIPQFMTVGGLAVAPRFCDGAAGDIDNDGDLDLYFTDYDGTETFISEPTSNDLNDRLLLNNGAGFFTDVSAARMTTAMLLSAFGHSCVIADMNGDGRNDIVKGTALGTPQDIRISYNNPANLGFFNQLQNAYAGNQPYHVAIGDLNGDGRLDMLIGDDGQDRFKLNNGNAVTQQVSWGPNQTFSYAGGSDDGFPGDCFLADLDNDGFPDGIITDVDVDLPGCNRRMHIFHNRLNEPLATMREEAELSGSSGWKGVRGMTIADLQGSYNVAAFDLDGDGWRDMVVGRCAGTAVWLNKPKGLTNYGLGTPLPTRQIRMTTNKVPKINTADFQLVVRGCPPNTSGLLGISDVQDLAGTFIPGLNCVLHIGIATPNLLVLPVVSDANGVAIVPLPLPNNAAFPSLPPFFLQAIFPSGPAFVSSDGLRVQFQN